MKNNKPKWVKPKLIVLVRGKHGEAVLMACKTADDPVGPSFTFDSCWLKCAGGLCQLGAAS